MKITVFEPEFLYFVIALGLNNKEIFIEFAKRPPIVKEKLNELLKKFKLEGKKVACYGAPAKGNTLLQYVGVMSNDIAYVTDNALSKQGKYTPGTHIPIVSPANLKVETPDYILILAWNYADSIIEREKWFTDQGGKFIIPVPEPRLV